MIKLYGIPRSRAMRPLWMLEELGLPYEQVKVSFVNDTRKPEFLRLNPNGHIPVLQDGDLVLWESLAINLYLARKYDKGLWPKQADDAAERFKQPLGVLDGALAGRDYLLGSAFTVADLNAASVLSWAPLAGLDLSGARNAQGWLGRC